VNHADLSWTGADGEVAVYRNGRRMSTTTDAAFTDNTGSRGSPTYTYQVCEMESGICSEDVEIRF
jgi:serine protease